MRAGEEMPEFLEISVRAPIVERSAQKRHRLTRQPAGKPVPGHEPELAEIMLRIEARHGEADGDDALPDAAFDRRGNIWVDQVIEAGGDNQPVLDRTGLACELGREGESAARCRVGGEAHELV